MYAIHTILVPTDFSPRSESALRLASAIARDYGARLILLHVLETYPAFYGDGAMVLPPLAEDSEQARSLLDKLPVPAHILAERQVREGDAAIQILEAIGEFHADLIVMGTHGRTGLGRLLVGSVAENVMRKATCPVLTVRTPGPEAEATKVERELGAPASA